MSAYWILGDVRFGKNLPNGGTMMTNEHDLKWAHEVHEFDLSVVDFEFEDIGSMVLYGSEDSPSSIWICKDAAPSLKSEFYCVTGYDTQSYTAMQAEYEQNQVRAAEIQATLNGYRK